MRFFSITSLVEEIIASHKDTKTISLVYSCEDLKEDNFNNFTTYPLIIILDNGKEKTRWNRDDILDYFDDAIGITLPKEKVSRQGIAVCSIDTEAKFSEKFNCNYYKKKFNMPGPKIIKEAKAEIVKIKQEEEPEVFDI